MVTQEVQPLKVLTGPNHQIEVYPDSVIIRHNGFFPRLFEGDLVIPIQQIKSVRLFESRFSMSGCLKLILEGDNHHLISLDYPCSQHRRAQEIKDLIEERIQKHQLLYPQPARSSG